MFTIRHRRRRTNTYDAFQKNVSNDVVDDYDDAPKTNPTTMKQMKVRD